MVLQSVFGDALAGRSSPGPKVNAGRFVRLPEVIRRVGLSKTEIYRRMKAGSFPAQLRISHRVAVWNSDQVDDWISMIRRQAIR